MESFSEVVLDVSLGAADYGKQIASDHNLLLARDLLDVRVRNPQLCLLPLHEFPYRLRKKAFHGLTICSERVTIAAPDLGHDGVIVTTGQGALQVHPTSVHCRSSGPVGGGCATETLGVRHQLLDKSSALRREFQEERSERRGCHELGSAVETALAIPAGLDEIVQHCA
jgi:hypothetical protein